MNIQQIVSEIDTDARFEREIDWEGDVTLTAPDGATLVIGDDYGDGAPYGDPEDWGFSYCTYYDADSYRIREYSELGGGVTEAEARSVLAAWYTEHTPELGADLAEKFSEMFAETDMPAFFDLTDSLSTSEQIAYARYASFRGGLDSESQR